MDSVSIQGCLVGPGQPVYVVAEIGANHDGNLETAIEMIRKASWAGVDAVKLQSFLADQLVTRNHPEYADLKKTEMPKEWYGTLLQTAQEEGVTIFSTATNDTTMKWMEALKFPCYKIASAHTTHLPLLRKTARMGRPVILSTGYSTLGEIEQAVQAILGEGNDQLVLLHCVSAYPAIPAEANLRFMDTLRKAFPCPVGYSDHTVGVSVPLAAVALGACMIEKHFTLDKTVEGEDHALSLEPEELCLFVESVREVEASLGTSMKTMGEKEKKGALLSRRSLHAACDISEGTLLTEEMISILRPGDGLPPDAMSEVVGKIAKRWISKQDPITWQDF